MMKLSHESKVRLGVGIGAFVLIIGLVFGTSRILIHFDGPWGLGNIASGLFRMDDVVDEDDSHNGGDYSAQPQQLSSVTFDAGSFQSLDLDVTSGTVEIKCVSDGPVRVIESGRVARGYLLSMAPLGIWPRLRALRSRLASPTAMTSEPSIVRSPLSCRASLPIT